MLKKGLSYLIVVLIAMQSVVAIADTYQSHHSDSQHENHEHFHNSDLLDEQTYINTNFDQTNLTQSDCHHCCYGHVMAHFILETGPVSLLQFGHSLSEDYDSYHSHLLFPDIRPPIS